MAGKKSIGWSVGQLWGKLQSPVAAETQKHPPKAPLLKARLKDCVVVLASCLPPSRFLRVEEPPPLPPGARAGASAGEIG